MDSVEILQHFTCFIFLGNCSDGEVMKLMARQHGEGQYSFKIDNCDMHNFRMFQTSLCSSSRTTIMAEPTWSCHQRIHRSYKCPTRQDYTSKNPLVHYASSNHTPAHSLSDLQAPKTESPRIFCREVGPHLGIQLCTT